MEHMERIEEMIHETGMNEGMTEGMNEGANDDANIDAYEGVNEGVNVDAYEGVNVDAYEGVNGDANIYAYEGVNGDANIYANVDTNVGANVDPNIGAYEGVNGDANIGANIDAYEGMNDDANIYANTRAHFNLHTHVYSAPNSDEDVNQYYSGTFYDDDNSNSFTEEEDNGLTFVDSDDDDAFTDDFEHFDDTNTEFSDYDNHDFYNEVADEEDYDENFIDHSSNSSSSANSSSIYDSFIHQCTHSNHSSNNQHKIFIAIANEIAKFSKCQSKQVGCIVVKDGRIISSGCNGTPSGAVNCSNLFTSSRMREPEYREKHHAFSEAMECHAEENAILMAARYGNNIEKSTFYVSMKPCERCLKMIANLNVKFIYYDKIYDKCVEYKDYVKEMIRDLGIRLIDVNTLK